MTEYVFRVGADARRTHIVAHKGLLTTLCGAEAHLPAGTHGVPCDRCFRIAGELAVAEALNPLAFLSEEAS